MKATGLRIVTGIAAGVALVAGALFMSPPAHADEAGLKAAFDDYAAGRMEDALKKLQEYVAANPGDDEVYRVLRVVDERVKIKALTAGGEHERLMRYLLEKAKPVVDARQRDPEMIKGLVEKSLSGDIDVRRRANLDLAARSGDYAVPYLLPALGDADPEKVVNAIFALQYIGSEAVQPLCAALSSPDARLRGYICAVLGDIKDKRALPYLRRAAEKDADEGVKAKANAAIVKVGPGAGAVSAAESFVRVGNLYYANDAAVLAEADEVHNLWRFEGDALVRYEVAGALLPYQLAQLHAWEALELQSDNLAARSLLVRSIVAQALEGRAMGEKAPEGLKDAMNVATSQGFDGASAALADALKAQNWDVAVECCGLVAATYGNQNLGNHPLSAALVAPERRVQYAAAIAALRMSPGAFPNSDKVPALGAQAASETALRQVFVVDDHADARGKLLMDLREGGYVVAEESDGYRGVARAKAAPTLDVIVIRGDLGAAGEIPMHQFKSTLAAIDELTTDARTKNMRIVVVVGGPSANDTKTFLTTKYGDKIAGFIEEPLVGTAYLPIVQAAIEKGSIGKNQAAALGVAADAADAFASTNAGCGAWDYKVAVDPLANNATDGASDDIKMNSVRALGNLKAGGGAALASILKSADAKEELKVAAAKALGGVLSRVAPTGDEIDALVASAKAGGVVGAAALQALGQAKGVSGDVLRGVFGDHKLEVGKKGE